MPISVPGLLLSKALVEQEDIPEERQRQLMLIGGAAPFPLGVVIAQLIARREAPSAAADRAETTGADGQVGRAAALAAARAEASGRSSRCSAIGSRIGRQSCQRRDRIGNGRGTGGSSNRAGVGRRESTKEEVSRRARHKQRETAWTPRSKSCSRRARPTTR
jgi:hypothetical protein